MTRSFIPAITTGLRPTPLIIVYGAKPAAHAFSSRRSKMYFFDFWCLFPATFRQSASFTSTNIDAYYLILACKAREHIDFNFTVDANEHRTAHRGHRSAGRSAKRRTACYNPDFENGQLLKLEK